MFVDDDNVLSPDYLQRAVALAGDHPFLGDRAAVLPEFEEPPPEWTRRYWGTICIRGSDKDVWSNLPLLPETMPCGAGLCVRRRVALHYLGLYNRGVRSIMMDRVGHSLASGGDNDLAACACDIDLGVGLFCSLKLIHLMPPQRVTEDYLCRLVEGIEFSGAIFRAERGVPSRPRLDRQDGGPVAPVTVPRAPSRHTACRFSWPCRRSAMALEAIIGTRTQGFFNCADQVRAAPDLTSRSKAGCRQPRSRRNRQIVGRRYC